VEVISHRSAENDVTEKRLPVRVVVELSVLRAEGGEEGTLSPCPARTSSVGLARAAGAESLSAERKGTAARTACGPGPVGSRRRWRGSRGPVPSGVPSVSRAETARTFAGRTRDPRSPACPLVGGCRGGDVGTEAWNMQIWRRSEAAGPCHFGPNVPRGRQLHGTGVLSLVATGAPGGGGRVSR
jgi:hypothetical protein